MAEAANPDSAAAIGEALAQAILQRRNSARARRKQALAAHPAKLQISARAATAPAPPDASARASAGFLLAMGDSWFDYPFYDILKLLEDNYGYDVESAAHRGDPIEAMAYQGGQLDNLARCMEKVTERGAMPKAVLVSGGGDDIAGSEFGMLLNNATSGISGWNQEIVDGIVNRRILTAYQTAIAAVNTICTQYAGKLLPIFVHGYDYPVPDGRGFLGGWGPLPGPWLQPGFHEKLFEDLPTNTGLMQDIIQTFNSMLSGFATSTPSANVHYIDLCGTLPNVLTADEYKTWWGNELHPTEQGFSRVADKFATALKALP